LGRNLPGASINLENSVPTARPPWLETTGAAYRSLKLQTCVTKLRLLLLRSPVGLGQGFARGCVVSDQQVAVVDTLRPRV